MTKRFVAGFVDVLQNGKRANLANGFGEQSVDVLDVVSEEEELVAKLGKVGFEADVGHLEGVELHLGAKVSLIAYDAAVMVIQFDIEVVDVVYIGRRDVVRACQSVQFEAVVGLPL